MNANRFLGNDIDPWPFDRCRTVIISAPLEETTTYGKGTSLGPKEIINASAYVELYDEDLDIEPCHSGIYTHSGISNDISQESFLAELEDVIYNLLGKGKFPVTIGGEHSLSISPVRALKRIMGNTFSVIQLDAHADLRDEYEGSKYSHACVMRRIVEEDIHTIQLGIRSLSSDEARLIRDHSLDVVFARDIKEGSQWRDKLNTMPGGDAYITLDVDVFDPSVISHTGTPEPGGLNWFEILDIMRTIRKNKVNILGFDLVEFSPKKDHEAQSFTCAKLIYKMIGMFAE
ncbi:MAG: agmatinase [candidate division KSB1 bacterium]|jgi:agmatinase|nr:agmatinase [candidate division KSB1 bacterium]